MNIKEIKHYYSRITITCRGSRLSSIPGARYTLRISMTGIKYGATESPPDLTV